MLPEFKLTKRPWCCLYCYRLQLVYDREKFYEIVFDESNTLKITNYSNSMLSSFGIFKPYRLSLIDYNHYEFLYIRKSDAVMVSMAIELNELRPFRQSTTYGGGLQIYV